MPANQEKTSVSVPGNSKAHHLDSNSKQLLQHSSPSKITELEENQDQHTIPADCCLEHVNAEQIKAPVMIAAWQVLGAQQRAYESRNSKS